MATTKIWDVKGWLGKLVIYVENPDKTGNPRCYDTLDMSDQELQGLADVIGYAANEHKTELHRFVSAINCLPETARQEMMIVKKQFGKEDGIIAFHGLQSFAPGEATPEIAHEIGLNLAERLWGERFQVIVATHTDKDHLHTHFIINSVSFLDGYRYNDCKDTYKEMRKVSDDLCREFGLSVITDSKRGKTKQYGEWRADQEGRPTWRGLVKADVDRAISEAITDRQFFHNLRTMGYEVKVGKDISVRPPGKERFVRLTRNFGEAYTYNTICERILQGNHQSRPPTGKKNPYANRAYTLKGRLRRKQRIGRLRCLYLYYSYQLGVIPKGRQTSAKVHFLYREDLRKLDTITKEACLLVRHGIDTLEQLTTCKDGLIDHLTQLTDDRRQLRNRARSLPDGDERRTLRAKASGLSKQIGILRREVKLCDGITARAIEIKGKIATVRREHTNMKEAKQHEHKR